MERLKYVFVFLLISLAGCATTKLTSFKDPDYGQKEFKRILVIAATGDLEKKFNLETSMVEALTSAGIYAVEGHKLFPPTRDFTDEEKTDINLKNNIDAHLVINVKGLGDKEEYVPIWGANTVTDGATSQTNYHGGYNTEKPWGEFETVLYDAANGKKAWIATSLTEGKELDNQSTVISSFCGKVVDKLFKDKLITKEK
jgi:hypothetical protein